MERNIDQFVPLEPTEDKRSLADLYIRQRLNNWSDWFGMTKVGSIYKMLLDNKQLLIDNNMVSKTGVNNSGFLLRDDYNFDTFW